MVDIEGSDAMRTENSLKNIFSSFASNIILNIIKFVCRIIFVKIIGEVYLGVNGLLSNVLGLLSLAELGIGTAINYSLYKPVANNDKNKIKSLMNFYKKAYHIIALVVLVIGLGLLPFLSFFIKDTKGIENLNIIYLIFLFNQVIGYLYSYKRTLIIADQKSYKLIPFTVSFNFIVNVFQIIFLFLTKNYIIYLLIQSIFIILENITVNHYINKQYPFIGKLDNVKDIDNKELNTIKKNVKALMFHKIGSYAVNSTDNLIISKFIGIREVGYYSNYSSLIVIISGFIYTFISNITASFGNLIVKEKPEKRLKVFEEMNFIYYIMYGISTVCFINLFNPFIGFVYGEKFVLSSLCVFLITINYYLLGMTNITGLVQSAAGLYDNDKFVPLIQATINLVISIVLGIKLGLVGVFIGTLVSTMLPLIIKPIIIYRHVFEVSPIKYLKDSIKQVLILAISILLSFLMLNCFLIKNIILKLCINLIVSIILPSAIMILVYRKSEVYKSTLSRLKFLINSKKEKVKK